MTTKTNRIDEIFADARDLQADALEMLALGKVRNAAEKAWGRLSVPPTPGSGQDRRGAGADSGAGLRRLESLDEAVRQERSYQGLTGEER